MKKDIPGPCGSQADRYGDLTASGKAGGLKGVAVHGMACTALRKRARPGKILKPSISELR